MNPLVSILIPAYNAAPWLAETLQSALAQTWPNTEIIVVDDGSRDDTLAIARSFASPVVQVLHQENAGAAAARNRAYRASQGIFLQYLDADDLLGPDKISLQVKRLQAEPHRVATCPWGRFTDCWQEARFTPEAFWRDLPPVDWLVACWKQHSMMHPAAWLLSRPTADRAGPWDESLSLNDDGEYFARVVLASDGVRHCPEVATYYRSGGAASLSGTRSPAGWQSAFRSLQLATAHLLAAEDSPRCRLACARLFQEFVYAAYPDVPELRSAANRRVAELGGSDAPCPGGPRFQSVAGLFGWKFAKRLQRWTARRLGQRSER